MNVMPHAFLASILAFSSIFATAAEVKNVSLQNSGKHSDEFTTGIGQPVLCCG